MRARPLLFALLLLGACRALEPPAESSAPPDLTLRAVKLEQYRAGELETRGNLDEVRYQRELGRAEIEGIALHPVSAGTQTGSLASPHATAELREGQVELTGGVHYAGSSGESLETERATVDLRAHALRGSDPVTITGDGYQAEAPRFHASYAKAPQVTLEGGVHATFAAAEAAPPPPPRKRAGPHRRRR